CGLWCSFFFSRSRHTRSKRDWSSDVCSSDLTIASSTWGQTEPVTSVYSASSTPIPEPVEGSGTPGGGGGLVMSSIGTTTCNSKEIGRASCRGKRGRRGGAAVSRAEEREGQTG